MGKKMKISAVLLAALAMLIFLFACGSNEAELDDSVIYQDVQDYITECMDSNAGISDFTVTQKNCEKNRLAITCEVTYGSAQNRAAFSLEYALEKNGWVLEKCHAEMENTRKEGVTWELDEDGVLTISGAGEMEDYAYHEGVANTPWWEKRDSIQSVVIEDGVTSIGAYAFHSCNNLTSIAIADSIRRVGAAAFASCGLTHIIFEGDAPALENHIFLGVSATVFFPNAHDSWTDGVMQDYGGSITWMKLPETEIMSLLTANQLLDGTCGPELCWTLNEDGILLINGTGEMDKVNHDYANDTCDSPWWDVRDRIRIVLLTNGVTSIGEYAFYDCGNLSEIRMSDGIAEINYSAFWGCEKLTHATISANADFWDFRWMIDICENLSEIDASPNNETFTSVNGVLFSKDGTELICYPPGRTDSSYTIPDTVTGIGYGTFSYCDSLCSVRIPDSVTEIGEFAFSHCGSLRSVVIPKGVAEISNGMFCGCESLTNVTIPDSVTKIGANAFKDCTALTSITLPNGVTEIGNHAFYGCTGLKNVTIPDSAVCTGDLGINMEEERAPEEARPVEAIELRESYVTEEGVPVYLSGVTHQIDLDQDGTMEQVETTLVFPGSGGPYPLLKLSVNGVDYSDLLQNICNPSRYFAVVDIDPNDGKLELAIQDYGPSVDYVTAFYHYEAGTLKFLGSVSGLFEDPPCDADFMDYVIHLQGDGCLQAYYRVNFLQTWIFRVTYALQDETLEILPEDFYTPMEVGGETWHSEQRGTVIWPNQDVFCYREMDTSAEVVVLPAQTKITLIGASEIPSGGSSWVKFQQNDTGETLYLFFRATDKTDYILHEIQLADGTWTNSGSAFENTTLYD